MPWLGRVLRFEARALVLAAAAIALLVGSSPLTVTPARGAEPKVAIIVGPAGSVTDLYRREALAAAAEARRFTSQVVTVLSPDATWPAAREALRGASIVVYLGHGNGFPSPYGDRPKPATQNGLGLNPVAGVDDVAHQYFGESAVAKVPLAPHAVVLLHHLCYATGESEPGRPAATLDEAVQRVDNYAAGWMRAGAEAVIADSSTLGPAWYVRAILSGGSTVEAIWRRAPSFHDHVVAFPSQRTPGMGALLDPTRPTTAFYRSLVARASLRADEVARGATLVDRFPDGTAATSAGPVVRGVRLLGVPVAGTRIPLRVDLASTGGAGAQLGVRWARLDRPSVSLDATTLGTAPPGSPEPAGPSSDDPGSASDDATASVDATAPAATLAPEILVTPEVQGDLVLVSASAASGRVLSTDVAVPAQAGLYRLSVTLHDGSGVAYDAVTQQRIPALVVRVGADLSSAIDAPGSVTMTAGSTVRLPVGVTNSGLVGWTDPTPAGALGAQAEPDGPRGALLVGRWLRLGVTAPSITVDDAVASVLAAPGATARVDLDVVAPLEQGDYLLVLDVVSPVHGSLTALGVAPVAVTVHVVPVRPDVKPRPTT